MAYFRCGGGGVPASVKTDMNAVLNKKFGTSTDYPPADWAPKVNLMGPLPERTVSSSPVADFSDGADDVPTKSLVVTIPPTLSGVSALNEKQTGRNLFNDKSLNVGLPATSIGSSIDTINTSATRYTYNGFVPPKSNIAIKGSRNDTNVVATCLFFGYFGGYLTEYRSINPYGNSAVIIDCSAFDYVRLSIGANSGYQAPTDMTEYGYVQAEIGSTAHDYEPYTAPTQYTASLGRTIYGGEVDIVNGTGTDENGNDFTFDGQEVPTRLGYNAFWSDEGDTEVTYRADIDLLLGGN